MYVDLGAEQLIGAAREGRKIAVEIKSFVGASAVHDLTVAIGQFNLYRDLLAVIDPARELFLAIPERSAHSVFSDQLGRLVLTRQRMRLLVFDEINRRIVEWIP